MLFKNLIKKDGSNKLYAPVEGIFLPIENVKDEVFSKKLLGEGVAFEFSGDTIYSPCKGKVEVVAQTKHAFGIKMDDGTDVILHVGLDTVNLNGKGFKTLIKKGDYIKTHEPILSIDRDFMNKHNIDLTVILLVTNKDENDISIINGINNQVSLDSEVISWK